MLGACFMTALVSGVSIALNGYPFIFIHSPSRRCFKIHEDLLLPTAILLHSRNPDFLLLSYCTTDP